MGLSHEGGATLLAVDDEVDLVGVAVKAVQHGQIALARYTKRVRDALCHQAFDQPVAGYFLTVHALIMASFSRVFRPTSSTAGSRHRGTGAHGLLRSVAVHPDWRAHGVGGRLVQRLLDQADANGRSALYLLTTTAEHYFPRFGFVRIGRDDVPSDIAATVEFTSACPASAICMVRYHGGAVTPRTFRT
jgi:GNAT superfamily N-acetyltransferase